MDHPQYLGALSTWYGVIYLYVTTVHTVFTASVCCGLIMLQTVNYNNIVTPVQHTRLRIKNKK